jgi:hypothetical protein
MSYFEKKTEVSVVSNVFKIIRNAFKIWKERKNAREKIKISRSESSVSVYDDTSINSINYENPEKKSLKFLDYAKIRHGKIVNLKLLLTITNL